MPKTLMFMTLAVLAVALAIMSYVVSPKTEAQMQQQAQQASADPARNAQMQKAEMERRNADMKREMEVRKKAMQEQAKAMKVRKPAKSGMEITGDWFRKHPDGDAGLSEMQKEAAANAVPPAKPQLSTVPGNIAPN